MAPSTAPRPLAALATSVVRAASRVRGERAIHAKGTALAGRLTVSGEGSTGAPLLDEPASYDVVLRLSRSVGLADALPDVLGLAVRVLDAHGGGRHQDLLLVSTLPRPLLRMLPVPAYDVLGVTYGSLLPYAVGGRSLLLGARALTPGPVTRLADLPGGLRFALLVATPHGPWQPVGELTTDGELPAPEGRRVRFNPWNTGGGLRPAGPLQSWRRSAYDAAHVGPDA